MSYPLASQELRVRAGGSEIVVRRARCPDHEQYTSDYQGVDSNGWLFRCKENAKHLSHIFVARPPRDVPDSPSAVAEWVEKQRATRLVEPHKAGQ